MAKLIYISHDNYDNEVGEFKNIGKVNVKDIVLVGFKMSNAGSIDFYYILQDEQDDKYLSRYSFIVNYDELNYFAHPLHSTICIDRLPKNLKENTRKIIEDEFNHNNSGYCDFKLIDIIDDKYVCHLISKDKLSISNKVLELHMNFSTYFKVKTLISKVIFKLPINPAIDGDIRYNNIKKEECTINCLGAESFENGNIISYFSIKNDINSCGMMMPITSISDRLIIKPFTSKQFIALYHNNFMISTNSFVIIEDKKDGNIVTRVGVTNFNKDNIELYIPDQNIEDSILLNPYKEIYTK